MKIAVILSEHLKFFEELDPFGFLERGTFPDRVCIGAVVENEEAECDDPAGLLVLKLQVDYITVEWIYVKEEYRMQGIGGALMEYAFNVSEDVGFDKLRLYLNEMPGRPKYCPYEIEFLNDYCFVPVSELNGEFSTTVKKLLKHPVVGASADKNKKTVAAAELSDSQKQAFRKYVDKKDSTGFLYDKSYVMKFADKNISRVVQGKEGVSGAILVQNNGENLYVTGLSFEGRSDELALCHGALLAMTRRSLCLSMMICIPGQ